MTLRCASLWQPYASAIPLGFKRWETRSDRSPIVRQFHAAAKRGEMIAIASSASEPKPLRDLLAADNDLTRFLAEGANPLVVGSPRMPRGAIVAVVWPGLVHRTEHFPFVIERIEGLFGDFSPGRYAIEMTHVVPLRPIPVKGARGLWKAPEEVERQVLEQLAEKAEALRQMAPDAYQGFEAPKTVEGWWDPPAAAGRGVAEQREAKA